MRGGWDSNLWPLVTLTLKPCQGTILTKSLSWWLRPQDMLYTLTGPQEPKVKLSVEDLARTGSTGCWCLVVLAENDGLYEAGKMCTAVRRSWSTAGGKGHRRKWKIKEKVTTSPFMMIIWIPKLLLFGIGLFPSSITKVSNGVIINQPHCKHKQTITERISEKL